MKYRKLICLLASLFASSSFAAETSLSNSKNQNLLLQKQTGFFRFSFDSVKMPQNDKNMGLLGVNYFADLTPIIYGGVGGYGSVTGNQGGLFVLGVGGGLHKEFFKNWWGDAGLYVGGGGGKSSLVGGGLMLRPSLGIEYSWGWARLGLHYSYIDFPDGDIRSHQLGLDLDLPLDFYYVPPSQYSRNTLFQLTDLHLSDGKFFGMQRNDFGLLLQAYRQQSGTRNVMGDVQDGTIKLVGAEFDHYISERVFWWAKAGGAFAGVPNGYMDVLGGLGYHWPIGGYGFAVVPQIGAGAGGGGYVQTGGGVLVQPQLGVEWPITSNFSARVAGGYIWAPDGNLKAPTLTALILYHLDLATGNAQSRSDTKTRYQIQGWRIQILNQTYVHPQRTQSSIRSSANLIALQFDQIFTPFFFFSYQAASAYNGNHTGGLATGMIGPGIQTPQFFNRRVHLFGEFLIGAGGGGGLALGGGAIAEPVVGIHYAFVPGIGLQASVGQLKALHNQLNTPVINLGITFSFGTLNRV